MKLYEMCDKIYHNKIRLDGIRSDIDHMRLPTADRRLLQVIEELDDVLTSLRERALKEEGKHD